MNVLVATDAAPPQVNGVVRTLTETSRALQRDGIALHWLTADRFASVPMPFYPEIRLALATRAPLLRAYRDLQPDAIHIATEGPIGHAMRGFCLAHGLPFTTSYHTRFPEYLAARAPVPEEWSYAWLRRFHRPAARTMVATASLEQELGARGFGSLVRWSRGVDGELFHPTRRRPLPYPRPLLLSVGRLAVEKNIAAFLSLDVPGTKVVVGDGPERASLAASFPQAVFLGTLVGQDLAEIYASADVFVFPSRTDTFGNVMLEALASGTPVAAYPVAGPLDIISDSGAGALDEVLAEAVRKALSIPRDIARWHADRWTWVASARQFASHLAWLRPGRSADQALPLSRLARPGAAP